MIDFMLEEVSARVVVVVGGFGVGDFAIVEREVISARCIMICGN